MTPFTVLTIRTLGTAVLAANVVYGVPAIYSLGLLLGLGGFLVADWIQLLGEGE